MLVGEDLVAFVMSVSSGCSLGTFVCLVWLVAVNYLGLNALQVMVALSCSKVRLVVCFRFLAVRGVSAYVCLFL